MLNPTTMAPRPHCVLSIYEISRLIEEEGADVNHRDIDGSMALHASRSSAVACALIEHGADINAKNSRGMPPIHRVRNIGVAKVLLEHGALVDAVDNFGNTPLHLCNDPGVVQLLLRHSASVSLRNKKGETPIHMSTYGSKVVALAEAGTDIDSVDNSGKMLLMKKSKCFYVFRLLSSLFGLNPTAFLKDRDGKTALDLTLDPAARRRLLKYLTDQNWRRRRAMVL